MRYLGVGEKVGAVGAGELVGVPGNTGTAVGKLVGNSVGIIVGTVKEKGGKETGGKVMGLVGGDEGMEALHERRQIPPQTEIDHGAVNLIPKRPS